MAADDLLGRLVAAEARAQENEQLAFANDCALNVAQQHLEAARARLSRAERVLRRCEWRGPASDHKRVCPCCERAQEYGHDAYCELATVIGAARKP